MLSAINRLAHYDCNSKFRSQKIKNRSGRILYPDFKAGKVMVTPSDCVLFTQNSASLFFRDPIEIQVHVPEIPNPLLFRHAGILSLSLALSLNLHETIRGFGTINKENYLVSFSTRRSISQLLSGSSNLVSYKLRRTEYVVRRFQSSTVSRKLPELRETLPGGGFPSWIDNFLRLFVENNKLRRLFTQDVDLPTRIQMYFKVHSAVRRFYTLLDEEWRLAGAPRTSGNDNSSINHDITHLEYFAETAAPDYARVPQVGIPLVNLCPVVLDTPGASMDHTMAHNDTVCNLIHPSYGRSRRNFSAHCHQHVDQIANPLQNPNVRSVRVSYGDDSFSYDGLVTTNSFDGSVPMTLQGAFNNANIFDSAIPLIAQQLRIRNLPHNSLARPAFYSPGRRGNENRQVNFLLLLHGSVVAEFETSDEEEEVSDSLSIASVITSIPITLGSDCHFLSDDPLSDCFSDEE